MAAFSLEQQLNLAEEQAKPLRLHLIGVAGSGMSGLAQLFLEMGHQVSGSDRSSTVETDRLQGLGLTFYARHRDTKLEGVDAVIYSSAIRADNLCLLAAREQEIPCFRRAEALAAILVAQEGIIVAGTHGKTTTSSMLAHLLRRGGLKPGHYIGAEIPILGSNAHHNPEGKLFVAEGDESDGTLVHYRPEHTILLNNEADHLDFYESQEQIDFVFSQLLEVTPGKLIYCRADAGASRLCEGRANAVGYGWDMEAAYSAQRIELEPTGSQFTLYRAGEAVGRVELGIPGRHNVLNATAALALAMELGVEFEPLAAALAEFRGANRRFQLLGEDPERQIRIFDDYGHHPTEIKATLDTARQTRPERLLTVFQPHRYTRTEAMSNEFGQSLAKADAAWVTPIYAASEDPIEGVNAQLIVDAAERAGIDHFAACESLTQARWLAGNALKDGDLLLSLGAGNVHEVTRGIARDLPVMAALRKACGESPVRLKLYEPMRRHTTLLVGGPAQFWAEPEDEAGFLALLQAARKLQLEVMVVGRGSNLLVRDGGIKGLVIHPTRGQFASIEREGNTLICGVGARLKAVANRALKEQLGGFAWMEGIPGNVGGSLRMNAGAMGADTFGQVLSVRVVTPSGEIVERKPEEMKPQYRFVPALEREYAVSVVFEGFPSRSEEIQAELDASKHKRKSSQPLAASAGCIFKNPGPMGAGQLIDELGLKGSQVGAAEVSEVHANFIVNKGGASAKQVQQLIAQVQQKAQQQRGIELETEVQLVGDDVCAF